MAAAVGIVFLFRAAHSSAPKRWIGVLVTSLIAAPIVVTLLAAVALRDASVYTFRGGGIGEPAFCARPAQVQPHASLAKNGGTGRGQLHEKRGQQHDGRQHDQHARGQQNVTSPLPESRAPLQRMQVDSRFLISQLSQPCDRFQMLFGGVVEDIAQSESPRGLRNWLGSRRFGFGNWQRRQCFRTHGTQRVEGVRTW